MILCLLQLGLASVISVVPVVINDADLLETVSRELGKMADEELAVPGEELAKAVQAAPKTCQIELLGEAPTQSDYASLSQSVFVLTNVYKCGKCDNWHLSGGATAWCLSSDGVMVTNYHVLEDAEGACHGVASREGKVWLVTDILAADKKQDLVVFRVQGENFQPLKLGETAQVGDKVRVISHPDQTFFTQTSGEVSRYFLDSPKKPETSSVRMSITADYAKGSSGGPVMNAAGEVVGIVASTKSIYYDTDKEGDQDNLQMVFKNTVPVSALKSILEEEATKTSASKSHARP